MIKTKKVLGGVTVAMAVASLIGCASDRGTSRPVADQPGSNTTEMMHCFGINACKGHNDCQTAANACAGFSSCKGEGFLSMSPQACTNVGGLKQDDSSWQEPTADFIHCSGVNVCKGHNDCKTASNACAGLGTCKGEGYIDMPAKSCQDMGGSVEG